MGVGLAVWSVFTGLNGLAWSFGSYLAVRMAVGIGEACCSPVAASLIGDLFTSSQRSRASGFYWLGFPAGLLLAFTTAGLIVRATGTWRATFFVAMIPGLLVALSTLLIREPARGRAEASPALQVPIKDPIRRVLRIRTIWWISLAGVTSNFSGYTAGSFMVPLLQRYYGLDLGKAADLGGLILGVTGLIGFTAGGWIVDKVHQRSEQGRLIFGAAAMVVASLATFYALWVGKGAVGTFALAFAVGWLFQYQFLVCVFPAIQDVVEPRLRAVAVAIFFALVYVLGAALGPTIVGFLSDRAAQAAMIAAHASHMSLAFRAIGLHQAMYLIPVMLLATGVALFYASRTFSADADAMKYRLSGRSRGKNDESVDLPIVG